MNPLYLFKRFGGMLRGLVLWLELTGVFGFALVKGVVGRGTTLHINVDGSPTNFQKIGNITDVGGPGGSATVLDASNLDSVAREKLMGLFDEGQVTVKINLDPDDTVHKAVRTARRNKTLCEFKLTLTDASPATIGYFFGYVTGFTHAVGTDKILTADITIEVDGEVNWQ
jgi:hypothetical protein